jgi:nitrogen regulatory protein PII
MSNRILKEVSDIGAICSTIISARGTLIADKWYQMFLPAMSPEQEVAELLVPNSMVETLMSTIVASGKLHLSGSGAIYSITCGKTLFPETVMIQESPKTVESAENIVSFKQDLTGIFCIIQKSKSESIARAAVNVGSPGPTVVFGVGRGIRERIGLLRIAISPEKELIRLIVDDCDADHVFDTMVQEGKLDTPGMGFIYTIPITKGLVNIASVFKAGSQSASIQQIVKAIDELKKGTHWRERIEAEEGASQKKRKFLLDLVRLTLVVERGTGDTLIQAAILAGAPGASVTYGRAIGGEEKEPEKGIRVSKEREIIEMTVSPQKVDEIIEKTREAAEKIKLQDLFIYTQQVPKALTYLG